MSASSRARPILAAAMLALLAGCRAEMYDQPRYKPLAASTFYDDGTSARPLIEGTVARGELRTDAALYEGMVDGREVDEFPMPVDRALVERGRERFTIYCSPCHGNQGDGRGMIVRRGFSPPPSFHSPDLLAKPLGHYFRAITNGYGAMYSYASRVAPRDRWAIIAYIRALQLSQSARVGDLPPDERRRLEEAR